MVAPGGDCSGTPTADDEYADWTFPAEISFIGDFQLGTALTGVPQQNFVQPIPAKCYEATRLKAGEIV